MSESKRTCPDCGETKEIEEFPAHRLTRCRECRRAKRRAWYAASAEHYCQQMQRWRAENPERNKEIKNKSYRKNAAHAIRKVQEHTAANFEKYSAYWKRYAQENRERKNQLQKDWNAANPGKHNEYQKKWNAENSDAVTIIKDRRRARQHAAVGRHTAGEWRALVEKFEGRCVCCQQHFGIRKLTRDHVVPLALGGSDSIENIQPLCRSCNSRKGAWHTTDYRNKKRDAEASPVQLNLVTI